MQILDAGLLSKSEAGTTRANLTFPNFVALSNGDLLANWRAGSAKDCDDERLEFSRAPDGGAGESRSLRSRRRGWMESAVPSRSAISLSLSRAR